jgi:putative ATP-binding cassette transporter
MAENFNDFITIKLKDMEFEYINGENERLFAIEPVNMKINRGELIFIIGGNGSGKSTFIKTLLNLYYPTGGEIVVDDNSIDEYNRSSYRDLFSIILNDFYLSKEIYGIDKIDYRLIKKLLKEMGLNNKTKFVNGAFTNIALSTGQKKRLALIVSILEDKQIYVFDEWAADQDPEFRKYFYETILKRLQEQGKTVIAVTHDDKYFNLADKIYKMQDGRMDSITS